MSAPQTIRTARLGKTELRLVRRDAAIYGLANGKIVVEGADPDDGWRRLHDEAGKLDPKYFGFDGARARLLHFFPNGFHSAGFASQERDYKLAAKAKLDATAPVEDAAQGSGYGEAVLTVFGATNLLSQFEKMRVQDVLRGPAADPFVRAAARFALGEGRAALADMERALRGHDAAKWTVATYLPFLWRPDQYMFLKPEVTKDFAARVGHPFASLYEPPLRLPVYESLLDLARKATAELASLAPSDLIDIQSFIWVVGDYEEGRDAPKP